MGNVFFAHFGPGNANNHCLIATAYLKIVADHVHAFVATICQSSSGYLQHDNAPNHKAKVISNWPSQTQSEALPYITIVFLIKCLVSVIIYMITYVNKQS